MAELLLLKFVVLPLWAACGVADWALHRHERIEHTSGTPEALTHLLMMGQMGAAVLLVLWFEFTPLVLAVCVLLLLAHEFTVYADLRWAARGRRVGPLEQMVHSGQEMLPLAALALLVCAHWSAWQGPGGAADSVVAPWRLRDHHGPPWPLLAVHGLGLVVLGCYVEEWWRCRRQAGRHRGWR